LKQAFSPECLPVGRQAFGIENKYPQVTPAAQDKLAAGFADFA